MHCSRQKGNSPLHYIAAHVQKIYGLDWSPNSGTELATCSQDNTVKFWDLNVLRNKAESIIATNLPVWRAKYTPVGNGIITVVVSHLRRIGDNSLWLWNGNCLDKPVYSFVGPQDVVIDFGFRIKRKTQRPMNEYLANFAEMNEDFINYKRDEMIDYHASAISRTENPKSPSKKVSIQPDLGIEVITWSKDQSLRIWDVDDNILKLVDYHPEDLQRFNNRYLVDDKFQHRHLQSRHLNRRHSSSSKLESEHDRFDSAVSGRRPEVLLEENDDPSAAAKWAEKLSSSLNRKSRSLDNSENSFINRRLTSANLRKNSLANSSSNFVSPTDLQEEFSLIDVSNLKNLWIEQMNAVKRFCVIRAKSPHNNFVYRIRIIFPNSYPNNIPPTFIFIDSSSSVIEEMTSIKEKSEEKPGQITNSDDMGPTGSKKNVFKPELFESPPKLTGKELKVFQESKADLLKILQNTAHMQVKRNRPCIEPCLRDLVAALDRRSTTMNLTNSLTPSLTMDSLYGSFHDVNIPFPRTCGARFCGADLLICFSRPSHLQLSANASNWQRNQIDSKTGYTPTPRALSALSYYLVSSKKSNTTGSTSSSGHVVMTASGENLPKILPISVSSFYRSGSSANSKVRHKSNKNKSHKMHSSKTRPVYVFNVAGLLPYNKFLAEYYM